MLMMTRDYHCHFVYCCYRYPQMDEEAKALELTWLICAREGVDERQVPLQMDQIMQLQNPKTPSPSAAVDKVVWAVDERVGWIEWWRIGLPGDRTE